MALLPEISVIGAPTFPLGGPAFFGVFTSTTWTSLQQQRPAAAHDLAAYLYLHCALMALDGVSGAQAWAGSAAAQAVVTPGPLSLDAGDSARSLAHACAQQFIAKDRPDLLLPLVAIFDIDLIENEESAMREPATAGARASLHDRVDRSSKHGRALHPAAHGAKPIQMSDLKKKGFGLQDPSIPAHKLPLFTMAALMEAQACWDALGSLRAIPAHLNAPAWHRLKLSSPVEIAERMKRGAEAARADSKTPSEAIATLTRNLVTESARAAMVISALPLPPALKMALLGAEHGPSTSKREIHCDDRDSFAFACEKAYERVRNGRRANLELPLRFDWTLHLLSCGAKPSFLQPRLPCGNLAKAARLFGFIDASGLRSSFRADQLAFIEKDDLLHSESEPATPIFTGPRRRL